MMKTKIDKIKNNKETGTDQSFTEFEGLIAYKFRNREVLREALTHSSFVSEDKGDYRNNQRMEFLGDSVLSIAVAEYLFKKFDQREEGYLTKFRASLVCEESLFEFAKTINLGNYLIMGRGEENSGGRKRPSILADAFEAIIAAIYLDGGYLEAKKFILSFVSQKQDMELYNTKDYKTALQEIIQRNREERLTYTNLYETGPDHLKTFNVEVHLNSNVIGKGQGKSKKQAEQNAAKEALELMGYET